VADPEAVDLKPQSIQTRRPIRPVNVDAVIVFAVFLQGESDQNEADPGWQFPRSPRLEEIQKPGAMDWARERGSFEKERFFQ
jgi:hypothetical protein